MSRPFIAHTSKSKRAPLGADPVQMLLTKDLGVGIEPLFRWVAKARILPPRLVFPLAREDQTRRAKHT